MNKKLLKRLLFITLIAVQSVILLSCNNNEDEALEDGSHNTSDVAVTGKVTDMGFSYATIEGFANLHLISATYSNVTVGIEYSKDLSFKECKRISIKEISGNKIILTIKNICPETKYFYRTFVEVNNIFYYGKDIKSFTTKGIDITKMITIKNIKQIDPISVELMCNFGTFDKKNEFEIGIIGANKEIKSRNTNFNGQGISVISNEINSESGNFFMTSLYPDSTYYMTPFISVGDSVIYGTSKKYIIPGISNLLTTGKVSNQKLLEATFHCSTNLSRLYPQLSVVYSVVIDQSPESKVGFRDGNSLQNSTFINKNDYTTKITFSNIDSATYYYHACCVFVGSNYGRGNFVVIAQGKPFKHMQLPSGNVDLGLSCLWSSTNLGATKPEEKGDKYLWGATEVVSWFGNINPGLAEISRTRYDAAYVKLGNPMRLPTHNELKELANCKQQIIGYNGYSGFLFTGPNGNSIFLPWRKDQYRSLYIGLSGTFDGYWSGTRYILDNYNYMTYSEGAYCLLPEKSNGPMVIQRGDGASKLYIRPVCNKK